jgi:hypothetical protein
MVAGLYNQNESSNRNPSTAPMSRFRNKIAHVGMLIDTRAVSNSEALTILSL